MLIIPKKQDMTAGGPPNSPKIIDGPKSCDYIK